MADPVVLAHLARLRPLADPAVLAHLAALRASEPVWPPPVPRAGPTVGTRRAALATAGCAASSYCVPWIACINASRISIKASFAVGSIWGSNMYALSFVGTGLAPSIARTRSMKTSTG